MSLATLDGRRVLVTGASGFLGAPLCRRLSELGAEVHGCSRTSQAESSTVSWHVVDLAVPGAVAGLFDRVEPRLVFHLASHVTGARELDQVEPTFAANLTAAVELLTAATRAGCDRIVLAGSMEEPAAAAGDVPPSPYAAAKWAASAYARMYHALYATPAVLARIFMVYGPGQRDESKLVPYVIRALLAGEVPRLSAGARPVDWIFIDDVVEGLLALATAPGIEGRTLDLGSGELHTVRQVAERIAARIGGQLALGALPDRPFEDARRAEVEPTTEATGWRPRIDLDDGLERTIASFRRAAG